MNNMFELPKLSYSYDALEPYIDAKTMEIHHSRHHKTYTDKFNEAITANNIETSDIFEILKNNSKYTPAITNHGGGYYNHYLYFETLTPGGSNTPSGKLLEQINKDFGSFENLKEELKKSAVNQFGSGWAWLIVDENKDLKVVSTSNQVNPLMENSPVKGYPILGIDVWEHAYYLKHQNLRASHVDDFLFVVNFDVVAKEYEHAILQNK